MLESLLNAVLIPFLVSYGSTLLWAAIIGLAIAILSILGFLLKPISLYIKALAEKHLSEKISSRVHDAIDKVENVMIDLITLKQETIKRMAKEAYQNDGVIDMAEVKEIAVELGNVAIKRLSPELNTLKNYFVGETFVEFVQDKIAAIVTQSVERLISEQLKKN